MERNTGSSSPGELEITFNTSEVAVCCCSASVRSRVFAWTCSNTYVADGDHSLIGEGLQQHNLFFAERLNFLAAKHNHPNTFALAQQGHSQHRSEANAARYLLSIRKFRAFGGKKIAHMHRFAIKE